MHARRTSCGEGERTGAARIEAFYYLTATGELEKAAQTYELWQQTYPRDYLPCGNLVFIYASLGNWEKALEEAREAIRLEPNDGINYTNLGLSTRTSTGWTRRRQRTSRRRSASWGVRTCSQSLPVGFSQGRHGADGAVGLGRHGQAGHGRYAAGIASRYGRLVWEVEECARTDPSGDGFSPAQRRERDGRSVSGGGGAARGGIGQPERRPVPTPMRP